VYLKSLELQGFKSFADKTRLDFEPGMTAIVGPNGCGKSNISDAIRWVLGEQSAKAMRGGQMIDCIFNGTDARKALGMAEVSLTLTDCEEALGTDYHEVTVTRRVYRSGEGQYLINKKACRLKDIQRLFMDTGIGTTSYSMMEQGRIDRILSARPEDRRAVFEEASGITRYKADKKEAVRKLDHTEANLLRLADIIKEVKRQIISLQRQAGKARRYKEIEAELRGLDIWLARMALKDLSREADRLEARHTALQDQLDAAREAVESGEKESESLRANLRAMEIEIEEEMEAVSASRAELDKARETIGFNRRRCEELESLAARDTRDAEHARHRMEEHRVERDSLSATMRDCEAQRENASRELTEETGRLTEREAKLDETNRLLHELRSEAVELESRLSNRQNELSDLDAEERSAMIRRERLAAERASLSRSVKAHTERIEDIRHTADAEAERVRAALERLEAVSQDRAEREKALQTWRREIEATREELAGVHGRLELLLQEAAEGDGIPGGARWVLDQETILPCSRDSIAGALADCITAPAEDRTALEAVLRAHLDSLIVRSVDDALHLVREAGRLKKGSLRAWSPAGRPPDEEDSAAPGEALLPRLTIRDEAQETVQPLLSRVRIVEELSRPDAFWILVTRDGQVARPDGQIECWQPEENDRSPLARRQMAADLEQRCALLEKKEKSSQERIGQLRASIDHADEAIRTAREELDECRRREAVCQGEYRLIEREAAQTREKLEAVEYEASEIDQTGGSASDRREAIQAELQGIRQRQMEIRETVTARSEEQRALEEQRSRLIALVTEKRVRHSELKRELEFMASRAVALDAGIRELEEGIRERSGDAEASRTRLDALHAEIRQAEENIAPLTEKAEEHQLRLEGARRRRSETAERLEQVGSRLREQRASCERIQEERSAVDVDRAEKKMRTQNIIERITGDYRISHDEMMKEPEPPWEDGIRPERDSLETQAAELRARLSSMGPVNLIAIEEHEALQERFDFLSRQQEDLVQAKQQLLDMIKKINRTTTELFSQTFQTVNDNFQDMFKRLFGGGSAKLVLVDEEDMLESGIEIIARPPGKKLQTVSLLSGGERTLTAVALLFALYMVKPSAFCVLDELDAALDESNIGRFVEVVQFFLEKSQFIVITHSQKTISAADILYGITMEEHGVSKIVSVKFHESAEEMQQELPVS
jgi:chromosome segregation protein